MPSFSGERNFIALEFCSGHTERRTVLLDLTTGQRIGPEEASKIPLEQDSQYKSQPCAFAAATSASALTLDNIPSLAPILWLEERSKPEGSFSIADAIAFLPWGTGPPSAAM